MTNTIVSQLVIFLIEYTSALKVYLYALHLLIYFCTDKAVLYHGLTIQKHQAVIVRNFLFLNRRLTLKRLLTPMKIVYTYQKF